MRAEAAAPPMLDDPCAKPPLFGSIAGLGSSRARRPSRVGRSLLDIDLPGFYPAVYPDRPALTRHGTASLGPDTRSAAGRNPRRTFTDDRSKCCANVAAIVPIAQRRGRACANAEESRGVCPHALILSPHPAPRRAGLLHRKRASAFSSAPRSRAERVIQRECALGIAHAHGIVGPWPSCKV